MAIYSTQTQGPHPEGVADCKELVPGQNDQRVRPLYSAHGVANLVEPVLARCGMDQVGDHLRIGGTVENIAFFAEFLIEMLGVDEVAVVSHGQNIIAAAHDNGLSITDTAGTGGGIAVVTYSAMSGKLSERLLTEYLGYQTHSGITLNSFTV